MPNPGRTIEQDKLLLNRVGTLLQAGLSQKAISKRLRINERDVAMFIQRGGFERPAQPLPAPTTPLTARPQYRESVVMREAREKAHRWHTEIKSLYA